MDHVDQALSTYLDLSGGIRRSTLKAALIGIVLMAFASGASAESLLPVRATGSIQVVGPAGLDQVLRKPTQRMSCRSHAARADFADPAGVGYPYPGE
jgi:hypothetical protein